MRAWAAILVLFQLPVALNAADHCLLFYGLLTSSRPVDSTSGVVFTQNMERLRAETAASPAAPYLITIVAQKRLGKTSLLRDTLTRARAAGDWVIDLNFERFVIVEADGGGLKVQKEWLLDRFEDGGGSLLPAEKRRFSRARTFAAALDVLAKAAIRAGTRLTIVGDEVGIAVTDYPDIHRALLNQRNANVLLAYAGNSDALPGLRNAVHAGDTGGRARFFELLPENRVSLVNYIRALLGTRQVTFTDEAIDYLLETSGGWPVNINLILDRLPDSPTIDKEKVLGVVPAAMQSLSWAPVTPNHP